MSSSFSPKILLLTAILSSSILSGCSAISKLDYETGMNVSEAQLDAFNTSSTKQLDVIQQLGEPSKKENYSNVEVWRYHYVLIPALPTQKNINQDTVFEWDENGKLLKAYQTDSSSSIL
ncbi:hypothetical protein [Alteromonas sp. C1M14]|uniref:hypothetical protein n=1 Tax=Alteromonas sp. C1M14 TaxID=2841567 RepID=UPI001C086768|nr:hypothetical protein [Alteromonas sp. C1M14]MBU2977432.1 hypothetical protein [Alteromonas sp. C1M14]